MNLPSTIATADADEITPWWCLRTKPKMEAIATRNIRVLSDEITVFNPTLRHRKNTTRGRVWFMEALFPGYLLVRCDVATWKRALFAITGVTGCVHFGHQLGTIPESSITELLKHFSESEVVTIQEPLTEGDTVLVVDGPMTGSSAIVTRLLPAQERVRLLVEFLGGHHEVDVPLEVVLGAHTAKEAFASTVGWSDRDT